VATPSGELVVRASRGKMLRPILGVVLIDALLIGVASWFYVRGMSRGIVLIPVALVWIGTPALLWRSRKRIQGR